MKLIALTGPFLLALLIVGLHPNARAIPGEINVRVVDNNFVRCTAFDPAGERLVIGYQDGSLKICSATTGEPTKTSIQTIYPSLLEIDFAPKGRYFTVLCFNGTAQLLDSQTGQPIGPRLDEQGRIQVMAFDPDGSTLVTGSEKGAARLWNVKDGKPLGEAMKHRSTVSGVAFSPDGKTVATCSYDGTARLWDSRTGEPKSGWLKPEQSDLVHHVEFNADGDILATAVRPNRAAFGTCGPASQRGNR